MPDKQTLERAKKDKQEGKAPTTQAGEFIREEFDHIREGKHGAPLRETGHCHWPIQGSAAGVELPPPKKGTVSAKSRRSCRIGFPRGQERRHQKAFANPFAGYGKRLEKGRACGGFAYGNRAAVYSSGQKAKSRRPQRCCPQGGPHACSTGGIVPGLVSAELRP